MPEQAAEPVNNESFFRPEVVNEKMEVVVSNFNLPSWLVTTSDAKTRTCPMCSSDLTWRTIRTVSLCLNPQHLGDIEVEYLCAECYANFFLHFRKACVDSDDFIGAIEGYATPSGEPVLRDKIPPNENNLADLMVSEDIQKRGEQKCPS